MLPPEHNLGPKDARIGSMEDSEHQKVSFSAQNGWHFSENAGFVISLVLIKEMQCSGTGSKRDYLS